MGLGKSSRDTASPFLRGKQDQPERQPQRFSQKMLHRAENSVSAPHMKEKPILEIYAASKQIHFEVTRRV
jgi:hypothetical protein